jgi:arginase family enzyme
VLTHHRLVAAVLPGTGGPRLLGWASEDAREAFGCVCDRGQLTAIDLAIALGWAENRARDTLDDLARHRLLRAEGELYLPLPLT